MIPLLPNTLFNANHVSCQTFNVGHVRATLFLGFVHKSDLVLSFEESLISLRSRSMDLSQVFSLRAQHSPPSSQAAQWDSMARSLPALEIPATLKSWLAVSNNSTLSTIVLVRLPLVRLV